jgi:hypothetical protein
MIVEISLGAFLVTQFIPCLFIHYQYLKYNRNTRLNIDADNRIMEVDCEGDKRSFRFDEIKSLRLALMADLYDGDQRGVSAHTVYHYAFLETQNGERFIITCLLVTDMRKLFKDIGINYTKDKVFWPMIRMSRYNEQYPKSKIARNVDGW